MRPANGRTLVAAALLAVTSVPAAAAPSSEPPPAGDTTVEPSPERAESPSPVTPAGRAKYDEGLLLFEQKQYAAAIVAFNEGYAQEPHRTFLFAKGQAQRLAGDCRGAMATYQAFLATAPPPLQIDATRLAMERCAHAPTVVPQAAAAKSPPVPLPAPQPTPTPAWRRPFALALWGGGALALGASTWFFLSARSERRDAADSHDLSGYKDAWNRGNDRLRGAEIALAASALFVAGGLTYVQFASKARKEPTNLGAWRDSAGAWGVHWRGHF